MSSRNSLVSICIPTYNSKKWVGETIHSALAQTWENKEIIIVDDGSVDDTYQIIKQFESDNVRVFRQENKGACSARNRALKEANGDFIQWLDADDILASDKIEIQLRNSNMNPKSRILHSCSWGFFYYCTSRAKLRPTILWQDSSNIDWLINRFGKKLMMPNHSFLVSRELSELAGPWNENLKINQDGEYFTRVIIACNYIKFHPNSVCYYRKANADSISTKNRIIEAMSFANNLCVDHLINFQNNETTREAAANFLGKFVSDYFYINSHIIDENIKRIVNLGGVVNDPERSRKFIFISKIFGPKTATQLKTKTWKLKVFIEKWIERALKLLGCK